jgi:hypothetical protein
MVNPESVSGHFVIGFSEVARHVLLNVPHRYYISGGQSKTGKRQNVYHGLTLPSDLTIVTL